MESIKQAENLTLTWSGTGGTFEVWTDQPGGTMALRKTISLEDATPERKTVTFPLHDTVTGEYMHGKLWGEVAYTTATGYLILHGGFYNMRRIGTHIGPGERWATQPLDL